MKQYIKTFFILSLLINILLIGYLGYTRSEVLVKNIKKMFDKDVAVTPRQLSNMNNIFYPEYIDTCNIKNGSPYKILIIGNSLTYHGVSETIGWNYNSGMAASSIEKDFAHLLFDKVESKLNDKRICLRISNFAEFERNLDTFEKESVINLINYKPDLIVFQLGENVDLQDINSHKLFEKKYIELIDSFKLNNNPKIICTTPFFPSLEKNRIIKDVALTTNSFLVDLSHLPLLELENYAKNDTSYIGDKSHWKVDGIGNHPGDLGMENIAQLLFININAIIEENLKF